MKFLLVIMNDEENSIVIAELKRQRVANLSPEEKEKRRKANREVCNLEKNRERSAVHNKEINFNEKQIKEDS